MYYTYDKVKNDIWDIIKDKTDFVYEPSHECNVCEDRSEWYHDPLAFSVEPPTCNAHYEVDSCRYFYADDNNHSNYDAPACVVGNWFVKNSFTKEELNVSTWEQLEGQSVVTIVDQSNLELHDDAREFLNLMQTYQDTGISWGEAYEGSVAKLESTE